MICDNCEAVCLENVKSEQVECICGHLIIVCEDCFKDEQGIRCPDCGHIC